MATMLTVHLFLYNGYHYSILRGEPSEIGQRSRGNVLMPVSSQTSLIILATRARATSLGYCVLPCRQTRSSSLVPSI